MGFKFILSDFAYQLYDKQIHVQFNCVSDVHDVHKNLSKKRVDIDIFIHEL